MTRTATTELKSHHAYKESGIPWIEGIPEHWTVERGKRILKKVERPVTDEDEVITCFRDGTVTLRRNRRTEGFTESLKEIGYQGIRKGDLVIHEMDAFAGSAGVSDSNGKGTPVYTVCEPTLTANAHYYAHIVREMARSQWISALAKGVRERSTDFRYTTLAAEPLPLPPLDEQMAIVRFLVHAHEQIQRYIAGKERLIALMEEHRQALVHQAVTRGLDPNVRLKPSGVEWMGDVPEHWSIRTLAQIADSFRTGPFGSMLHQSDYTEGGTPVINPIHIRSGVIVEDPSCSVSEAVADRLSAYRLAEHDLIFSRRGELGRCALVRDRETNWLCGTGSIRVRIEYASIEPEFLIQALQVQWVGEYLSLASVGATMNNLNTGILKSVPILVPPVREQRYILEHVGRQSRAIHHAIRQAHHQINLMNEYRTRLIADVVTGQLDVRDAAAQIQETPLKNKLSDEVVATQEVSGR